MNIVFCSLEMEKIANNSKELRRVYGTQAAIVQKRLIQLEAAPSMQDMSFGRPHALEWNYKWYIAIDIKQPYRIILRPIWVWNLSDWKTIVEVEIVELCYDYHRSHH